MASAYADCPEIRHGIIAGRFSRVKASSGEFADLSGDWTETMAVDGVGLKYGELTKVEALLFAQATSLDAIFTDLALRAAHNFTEPQYLDAAEAYLKLALKAQAQSRATLQTLVEAKMPKSITITKQANIAGQQIVNNGGQVGGRKTSEVTGTRTGENANSTNELLGEVQHERLDTGTQEAASRVNQDVEAVGKVHRGKNPRRKKAQ